MVIDIFGINHFDRFMISRIELLPFSRNRFHSELRECINQLLLNQFHTRMKLRFLGRTLQRAVEAVERFVETRAGRYPSKTRMQRLVAEGRIVLDKVPT